jgi:TP53 regulating kinase-like protein
MTIEMEFIEGPVLRDALDLLSKKDRAVVCQHIGEMIARLHNANIIHGDLTTSNMILKEEKADALYFIDFGLGHISLKVEDKAVDLHLLKQALVSKHNKIWKECYDEIMHAYSKTLGKDAFEKVKERIGKIEKRGRYSSKD